MNSSQDNIIINSCQYTPVYVIQNPSVNQARSFVIAPNNENAPKPVGDSLRSFYENSGKIANNLQENVDFKPKIIKKVDSCLVGNNLKLASFLLPKNETSKQYVTPMKNIVLKPVVPSCNTNVINTVPKLDINRKIVKLKNIPNSKSSIQGKKLPKIKPKEIAHYPSKHTSVQLLKLGETYHSLNQLSDDQMTIVNHALKMFSDPEKTPKEPAYDPVTNTRFIYKVLSPKDLTVVGKNKLIFKQKRPEVYKEMCKKEEEAILKKKIEKKEAKPIVTPDIREPEPAIAVEEKVTRSGRKVKLPKHHTTEEESPHKPRKKNGTIVSCFQCSLEFSSLYRLQRHYENHPTHIPAKIHSNLFHCLLAIIKSGSEEDRANIFIQQLEQLIAKFKSLLPCLLKKVDGNEGKLCNISDDIARLLGMNPGKYNLNIDALSCIKDTEGHCRHNPPKNNTLNPELNTLQNGVTKQQDEVLLIDNEPDDCARINSVVKWPTVTKRSWKQKVQNTNPKKVRLNSECDTPIDLGVDDFIQFGNDKIDLQASSVPIIPTEMQNEPVTDIIENVQKDQTKKPSHIQFHSAHFDIRSSPIKQSSTVFCKFQINPEKIPKYEVQIIKPLEMEKEYVHENSIPSNESLDTNLIFNDNIELPTKDDTHDFNFDKQDWTMPGITTESNENDIKSNTLIEPALLHFKNDALCKSTDNRCTDRIVQMIENQNDSQVLNNLPNPNQSVLNFLDSLGSDCLSYPETEIRNNTVDFQLDLFSFSNT